MKKYKYKREHFDSQEEYDRFRLNRTRWQRKWLGKHELANPEHKERRLLRQRLYSRYHHHTDCRKSFADWLFDEYAVKDIRLMPIDNLRALVTNS